MALQLGLLAEGTGDASRKIRHIVHLQQELKEKRRDKVKFASSPLYTETLQEEETSSVCKLKCIVQKNNVFPVAT